MSDNYPMREVAEAIGNVLFELDSADLQFNPYCDCNPELERKNAPAIRRKNLDNYLRFFNALPTRLIVAEAPGPWGCRFSGVPITSEDHLVSGALPFVGTQASLDDHPKKEYSATVFWRALTPHASEFFVWNTVPLHPYKENQPLSIRTPRKTEVDQFSDLLRTIVEIINPKQILAVGRVAERTLAGLGFAPHYVRHPSQGGAKIFSDQMSQIFAG